MRHLSPWVNVASARALWVTFWCSHASDRAGRVSSADPVWVDRLSRPVRRRLALRLLFRVALLPNKLHGLASPLFLKFLHSGELFVHFK